MNAAQKSPVRRSAFISGLGALAVASPARAADKPERVTLAVGYGAGFAPLIVMKRRKLLERTFPTTALDWRVLASGAAIRDGVIANEIQVATGSAPPFLIGWDKGVPWWIAGNLCTVNLMMVANDAKFRSLHDFGPADKIATPALDSIETIQLRKAAKEQLGNASALDANLVFLPNPDGVAALASGQIAAHYTAPPYQNEEISKGGHIVVQGNDVFPKASFTLAFVQSQFARQYPDFAAAFCRALDVAVHIAHNDPDETALYLSQEYDKMSLADARKELSSPDIVFETTPRGVLQYAAFMREIGLLGKVPASMKDIEIPGLGLGGN